MGIRLTGTFEPVRKDIWPNIPKYRLFFTIITKLGLKKKYRAFVSFGWSSVRNGDDSNIKQTSLVSASAATIMFQVVTVCFWFHFKSRCTLSETVLLLFMKLRNISWNTIHRVYRVHDNFRNFITMCHIMILTVYFSWNYLAGCLPMTW